MAIMQRCCCCGVRPGTIASAIYSMVIAILGLANFGYGVLNIQTYKENLYAMKIEYPDVFDQLDIDSYVCAMKAEYIFACVFLGLLLVSSILAIMAINRDTKELLVPFLISKMLGFVWYAFAAILVGYFMAKIGTEFAGAAVIALMILLVPFFISDIVCFLCVLSQYQEYRDGRGRQSDQNGRTTVIIQQSVPAGAGGFSYSQMQNDAPPAYGPPTTGKTLPI